MRVEVSGIKELAAHLEESAPRTHDEGKKVISKGALNIKDEWRSRWRGFTHAPALPSAISYDVTGTAGGWSAEIGPDKRRRQGALGNLLEFGSLNNAPRPGGQPALDLEAPRFEDAVGDVAEKILGE